MKNKILRFLGLLSVTAVYTLGASAQGIELSSNSKISILSCSEGEELYTQFGHSAIRVVDTSQNIDLVFNYGTFDFDTPNFYLKFVNGELDYMLSVSEFQRFQRAYSQENRSVREYVLKLSQSEKQELWNRLIINYQPQNRFYRYDFFFDNCATRIRDLIFDVKHIDKEAYNSQTPLSFRSYLHSCIGTTSWASQGIDMILGVKTDQKATLYQRAFLPVYLDSLLICSKLIDSESILIDKSNAVYSRQATNDSYSWLFTSVVFLTICILILVYERKNKRYFALFDVILFSVVSLAALLFWYGWLVSAHSALDSNVNVLWASLFYIPLIIALLKKCAKLCRLLAIANLGLLAAFILLSILQLQSAPYFAFSLSIVLILRNAQIISLVNKKLL